MTEAEQLLIEIRDELRAANRHARLWSSRDVADYLGTSLKSAQNRVLNRADFPRPLQVPGVGRRWRPADIRAYVERSQKSPGGPL